ncbi:MULTISPECIES: alpha/beta hydrolase [Actinoalloteichus]|uniref:Alpha/beta hydrolase n=1 Tax=Actinoalloteichus fjordicus TaxID=1612552 RepID=A0AAC9PQC5_9PSEU|nr:MULTISPECIES: alpha/beta hydrolase [Actinoalloteichus]APU12878.1 Alpha/beta hydrolase [Actinoalloteichus fjordicus]APU18850.1 Alpha/beta hydrolase [Actinoalloteichus sp. GBA129-24]
MVSFGDLRRAEPGRFEKAAENWSDHADRLSHHADDLAAKVVELDGWHGEAADAARAHFGRLHEQFTEAADTMAQIPPILLDLTDQTTTARDQLLDVVRRAQEVSLTVYEDGRISAPSQGPGHQGDFDDAVAVRDELVMLLDTALRDVSEADQTAAAALAELLPEMVGLTAQAIGAEGQVPRDSIPGPNTDPADVKDWWDSLSPAQQESLIYADSDLVGGLDGVPAEVRDRANRLLLEEQRAELEDRREQLEAMTDRGPRSQRELDDINETLAALEDIRTRLEVPESESAVPAFLMKIDIEGNGRAIVAAGNPDEADNVVTSVPGMTTDLTSVRMQMERSDVVQMTASMEDRAAATSVITWIGYDAPKNVDAMESDSARNATAALISFQEGLRATHHGEPSNNTVMGHSYGSVVIGHTASSGGIAADNLIFAGSPGVGVDHVSELGIPAENVHATMADDDFIGSIEAFVHGRSPADEAFGGQVFESPTQGEWSPLGTLDAHSAYWDPESDSLERMGRIVVGQ